jgi:hypothetical protein
MALVGRVWSSSQNILKNRLIGIYDETYFIRLIIKTDVFRNLQTTRVHTR